MNKLPVGLGMVQQWLRHIEPSYLLNLLKENGVDFIEIHLTLKHWEARAEWLVECQKQGLFFTFHAPYQGDYDLLFFDGEKLDKTKKIYIETFEAASAIVKGGSFKNSRINLHGASQKDFDKPLLIKRTADFIRWLLAEKEERGWPFDFFLELLPHDPGTAKVGDRIPDLIEIDNTVGSGLAGFCWDFGHFKRNELLGQDSSLDLVFLDRVGHIHVHDIRDNDIDYDHCPLNFGNVPFEKYMDLIKRNEFHIVIELNYAHASACGNPEEGLISSIKKVIHKRDLLLANNVIL